MRLSTIPPRVALVIVLALLALPATASADLNANTDDSNVSKPTGWWTYTNVTPAQIGSILSARGARLTDIEPYNAAAGRWSVTMVKNAGAYAVPGWWWYYGLTGAGVTQRLNANKARLIHIQPYTVNGKTRFAAVMVRNTGAQAREWYWGYGATSSNISSHLSSKGTRLTDLETYHQGGNKRYAFVSVKNSGGDANGWYWWLNQSSASLAQKLKDTGTRLIDLERQPNGTYNGVAVRGNGSDNAAWWWSLGFRSMASLNRYALQLGVRPLDIETYVSGGHRRYSAVFIDNSNRVTRRIRGIFAQSFLDSGGSPTRGIFEAYLKRVGSSTHVNLNSSQRAETASSLKALHLLHAMRQVQARRDSLNSRFVYFDYPSTAPWPGGKASNACPNPSDETNANRRTDYGFEKGLDEMMRISDNRTTRGVVRRYGGFGPFNSTAAWAGLKGTTMRHNIGCAYRNPATGKFSTGLRNDTTAADLARIYESVWNRSTLNGTTRDEFLESANPSNGVNADLRAIIKQEAARLGKSRAVANRFGDLVRRWGKAGNYGTCLPSNSGGCGQTVAIASGAGLIRLPIKTRAGAIRYRTYVFARLYSDAPTGCPGCPSSSSYSATYKKVANELYREQIRSALKTF